MMANIGFLELLTIVVVALLLFGPETLPKAATNLAKLINKGRSFSSQLQRCWQEEQQLTLTGKNEKGDD